MALVKCKECGEQISSGARICPKCGVKRPKQLGIIGITIVAFLGLLVYECSKIPTPAPSERAAAAPATPQLELLSYSCARNAIGMELVGKVRNLSTENLDTVWVSAEFTDAKGNVLATERTTIDMKPLLPGQSSPFKAMSLANNPAIKKCAVSGFSHTFAGQISWKSSTK